MYVSVSWWSNEGRWNCQDGEGKKRACLDQDWMVSMRWRYVRWDRRRSKNNTFVLHHPGIEPGAQRWQRWILPLNQWCPHLALLPGHNEFLLHTNFIQSLFHNTIHSQTLFSLTLHTYLFSLFSINTCCYNFILSLYYSFQFTTLLYHHHSHLNHHIPFTTSALHPMEFV
jgi:hypothetical protein